MLPVCPRPAPAVPMLTLHSCSLRSRRYSLTDGTPGPIYEVHDAKIFDTIRTKAPNTVWGKGRGSRFKTDSVWGY
jgi:hypothetical protein